MGGRAKTGSSSIIDRILRLRVEEYLKTREFTDVDDLVSYLRTAFPQYTRHNIHKFTNDVRQILPPNSTPSPSPAAKRKSRLNDRPSSTSTSTSTSADTPKRRKKGGKMFKGMDTSEEESDSTSEDAIYDEKLEPKFDLTKDMLLKRYTALKKTTKIETKPFEEVNFELEVVNHNKEAKKVDFIHGGLGVNEGKGKGLGNVGGGEEGSAKYGPRFKDIGGLNGVLQKLKKEVMMPLYHPQLPQYLGVRPIAGILLHGPPGCGKTKLAHAIANEAGVPFYKIVGTEMVSGVSGASEENIRELFSKAYRTAPSIVFIDEIEVIASKRENVQREMERRIVTQLMTCMEESHRVVQPADGNANSDSSDSRSGHVLVIGATNRPDAIDPALRRPGRFDREIFLGVPDEKARIDILTVLTQKLKLEGAFDLVKIARSTPGFVGGDLEALVNQAGNLAMGRIADQREFELAIDDWWKISWSPEEMNKLNITMADFEEAAKLVQPSSRREGFSAIPNVKWEDVGGLNFLRQEFDEYIVKRIKYPEVYEEFGVDLETGFLLYGPPGCGKTLIAKAVANEAGANFIHIKGPELLNKYVGESELAVRTIFSRARTCAPCILFFDEVDALTTKRGKEGGWVVERLLNQLLVELDGADQRRGVFVIGATNRPEVMDQALLRPGRFGTPLYVPLPTPDERGLILKALARKKPIDADVDLIDIARSDACKNLSGADLAALLNGAAMVATNEKLKLVPVLSSSDEIPWTIKASHFEQAMKKISPSVSDQQKNYYNLLSESFGAAS